MFWLSASNLLVGIGHLIAYGTSGQSWSLAVGISCIGIALWIRPGETKA